MTEEEIRQAARDFNLPEAQTCAEVAEITSIAYHGRVYVQAIVRSPKSTGPCSVVVRPVIVGEDGTTLWAGEEAWHYGKIAGRRNGEPEANAERLAERLADGLPVIVLRMR